MVFISYQRSDTLYAAHATAYALRLAGYEPFVDTGSVSGGELYPQAISKAVSISSVMLALIGPDFNWPRLRQPNSVIAFEWRRAQFYAISVIPVLVDGGQMPSDDSLPAELRWFTKRDAYVLRAASVSSDIDTLIQHIPRLAATPRRAARVLWVDDRPANNEGERSLLRRHGIVFDNVVSTEEAVEQLANESYDLVITDLGRRASSDRSSSAGYAFLEHPTLKQGGPPVIVYAGASAISRRSEILQLGAVEATDNPQQLIETVLRVLGRAPESVNQLAR